jgi:hypothetical protein
MIWTSYERISKFEDVDVHLESFGANCAFYLFLQPLLFRKYLEKLFLVVNN